MSATRRQRDALEYRVRRLAQIDPELCHNRRSGRRRRPLAHPRHAGKRHAGEGRGAERPFPPRAPCRCGRHWHDARPTRGRVARQRLQRKREVGRGLEACRSVLLQAPRDDPVQRRGNQMLRCGDEIRRVLAEDGADGVGRRFALEGAPPGEHLVEHRAEGKEVGARIHRLAAHLLGGHVTHRAQHLTRVGIGGAGPCRREPAIDRSSLFGQTEVEDLRAAIGRHEDVRGLQIAMHDAAGMRRRQTLRNLLRQIDGLADGKRARARLKALGQGLPFEQLRHQVVDAALGSHVVHRQDVGMVQGRRRARFPREPLEAHRVVGDVRRQHLDGHVAPEPGVVRPVNLTHAARADRSNDTVRPERGAWGKDHRAVILALAPTVPRRSSRSRRP